MVVLDDSKECLNAMRFAAMRAANSGGGVTILSVISPDEFNHWIGVSDIMREEARERIEVILKSLQNGCAIAKILNLNW